MNIYIYIYDLAVASRRTARRWCLLARRARPTTSDFRIFSHPSRSDLHAPRNLNISVLYFNTMF